MDSSMLAELGELVEEQQIKEEKKKRGKKNMYTAKSIWPIL